ncbi:hypothetical protein AEAC466_02970 [Asticcacaulis sp. AC466]|uniref:hypothetical protein n=1 Tax=Asticcacaulis sp. AC466 TaxID=1282362 RepID=UPI0003C3CD17|nr:hypothetical protein [Asticcacaulis sp. AC466]ESQ86171.1 hypothetical protein AEAC466_02970 [Asticcacaulis sp. AC466]
MKRSIVILAGLGVIGVSLSGCESYYGQRYRTSYVDVRTQKEKADQCVAAFEPDGKAPQVMTYDSNTKTEVHVNQDGRRVDVTAQNAQDNTSLGMGGKVGGKIPDACTDADPNALPAIRKRPDYHQSWDHN